MALAVWVSPDGRVRGALVRESHETPAYLERVRRWLPVVEGADRPGLDRVDGVTGATLTSDAVRAILAATLDRLAGAPAAAPSLRWREPAGLVLLCALALALHLRPGRAARRVLLLGVLAASGVWLNAQYSLDQVFALLGGRVPAPGFTVPFLLVAGVPLLVLLFGNVYCGYLCPFGALQELLGEWTARFNPDRDAWRRLRAVKYLVLGLAVAWFSVDLARERAGIDPLVAAFSRDTWREPPALLVVALAGALLFRRFWCRQLCPAGAFLSLLGALRPLRRWLPAARPGGCDLGVTSLRDLDCLQCGGCRLKAARVPPPARRPWPALLAVAVAAALALLVAQARRVEGGLAPVAAQAGGDGITRGRPMDVGALRALIGQGKLSGREALHYRPYRDEDDPAAAAP